MRSVALRGIGAWAVLCCACEAARAADDWTPGKYMTQAVARIMGSARVVTDETEYGYDGSDVCFMAGFCQVQKSLSFTRQFKQGEKYALLGGGDDDARDVDIAIADDAGNVVGQDAEKDASPVVMFEPPRDGKYAIQLTLYDASANSFVALAILAAGGYDVPVDNLIKSAGGLISHCEVIAGEVKAAFLDTPNSWAVWGCMLAQTEAFTLTRIDMGTGNRAITAAGDTQVKDIDLALLDGDSQQLEADTEPDANPLIIYACDESVSYGMRVSNAASDGPSMVLAAILKIE